MNSLVVNRTPYIIAVEINSIKDQTKNIALFNSIEIGRKLVEAKELVPHGEWGKWLEKSVEYSQSTANNLMKIFNEYGSNQISLLGDNAKSQALGNLSYTQAVALLGIPAEEREEFVQENDVEKMTSRELQQAIKEKEQALKEKLELEKKFEKSKKEAEKAEALKKELDKTKELLKEAQASGNNEEVERLQTALDKKETELNDSKNTIKELEDQLSAQPLEAIIAEKVPEAVEKELEELRVKAQSSGTAKFKVHFDILVKSFSDLLGALEELKADEEIHEKYRNAVHGLIDKMVERL